MDFDGVEVEVPASTDLETPVVVGSPGPKGDPGPAGADGAIGPQGPQGDPGPTGADGPVGPEGPVGPQGPVGPEGPAGPAGADGQDGTAGVGVPAGGTAGQVARKASAADFDVEWADPSGGASGMQLGGQWTYSGTPGEATPGWGALNADVAPASATTLYFNNRDANGLARAAFLKLVTSGMEVWAQSDTDDDAWVKYTVTGQATRTGDVVSIPVSAYAFGPNAANSWTIVNVGVVTVDTGGSGGGSALNPRGAWSPVVAYAKDDQVTVGNEGFVATRATLPGDNPAGEAPVATVASFGTAGGVFVLSGRLWVGQVFQVTQDVPVAAFKIDLDVTSTADIAQAQLGLYATGGPGETVILSPASGHIDSSGGMFVLDEPVVLAPGNDYVASFRCSAANIVSALQGTLGADPLLTYVTARNSNSDTSWTGTMAAPLSMALLNTDTPWALLAGLEASTNLSAPSDGSVPTTKAVSDALAIRIPDWSAVADGATLQIVSGTPTWVAP